MGGGGTNTTTQTTAPTNPAVDATTTKLLNNLQGQVDKGTAVFGQSLYPGLSSQTQTAVGSLFNNPNSQAYGAGISDAIGQQAQIAAGNFGADPVRSRLVNDVSTNTNAILQGSGRFGSGSHEQALIDNVGGSLAQYDYGRQQQAMQNLPQLFQASMLPASAQLQAGQIMDANALAQRQGEADLFERQNNAGWNTLGRASSILAGTAGAGGQTTTQTSPAAPWWQPPLQIGGTLASAFF